MRNSVKIYWKSVEKMLETAKSIEQKKCLFEQACLNFRKLYN